MTISFNKNLNTALYNLRQVPRNKWLFIKNLIVFAKFSVDVVFAIYKISCLSIWGVNVLLYVIFSESRI